MHEGRVILRFDGQEQVIEGVDLVLGSMAMAIADWGLGAALQLYGEAEPPPTDMWSDPIDSRFTVDPEALDLALPLLLGDHRRYRLVEHPVVLRVRREGLLLRIELETDVDTEDGAGDSQRHRLSLSGQVKHSVGP